MTLFEIVNENEDDPIYRELEIANGTRQYGFLFSMVVAALKTGRPFLSTQLLKALNFQAIACLHSHAGEYRPCQVTVGKHTPPEHYRVQSLMDDFINDVNRSWEGTDAVALASYVLWRLNFIHPFINGNGRTARAACYFVLCVKSETWLPGAPILPELIRANRDQYVEILRQADESLKQGAVDLAALVAFIGGLLEQQLDEAAGPEGDDEAPLPAEEEHEAPAKEGQEAQGKEDREPPEGEKR